jgi:hypothetical protein
MDREPAMPPRTARQILDEWHRLAEQRDEASDTDVIDAITHRIEQIRREYIEGTPPDGPPAAGSPDDHDEDERRVQMELRL